MDVQNVILSNGSEIVLKSLTALSSKETVRWVIYLITKLWFAFNMRCSDREGVRIKGVRIVIPDIETNTVPA